MDFLQALGLCDHRLLQCPYRNIESGSCLDNPEASSCGDLIISAAPGVKLDATSPISSCSKRSIIV
jgi:hypothetical protein